VGGLLPALGSGRPPPPPTANMVNLRSLGQAMQMYISSYDALPPFRLPAGQVHPTTGRPQARWQWFLADYLGKAPFEPRTDEEYQSFLTNDDLERLDNPVFQDPSQRLDDFRSLPSGRIQIERNGSYGYNYHYLGNNRILPSGKATNFPVRAASIQQPARTISLADSLGNQTTWPTQRTREHSYTIDPPRLDTAGNNAIAFAQGNGKSPGQARHLGRATVSFLDGHARSMTLEDMGYVVTDQRMNTVEHNRGDNALFNGRGHDPGANR
jgi:prepilin-type processing-associated H-X9-DG protein